VEDLIITGRAVREGNPALASTVGTGAWLRAIQRQIASTGAAGVAVQTYTFQRMTVVLVRDPTSPQSPPRIGIRAQGTIRRVTYARPGGADVIGRSDSPFRGTFVMVLSGGHYLIAAEAT
jgi:hypothetical protein